MQQAFALGILTETEAATLREYDRRLMEIVHVDDFAPDELGMRTGEEVMGYRPQVTGYRPQATDQKTA